jgi:hypothetical protein
MSSTKQRPAGGTEHPRNKQRRRFLLGALGVTGALVIGWGVVPPRSRTGVPDMFPASPGQIALNGWIKIGTDGTVTVAVPPVEMGQGIDTAFAMLVAEELGVPLDRVRTQTVTRERIYGNVAALVDSLPIHPDDDGKPWARALRWMLAKSARELGLNIQQQRRRCMAAAARGGGERAHYPGRGRGAQLERRSRRGLDSRRHDRRAG